ncbi:MAG: hypothetical protein WC774_00045 [Candidatus Gracilibacteria bacterium]
MTESPEQCLYPTALEYIAGLESNMKKLHGKFSTEVNQILSILAFGIGIETLHHLGESHDHLVPKGLIETMTKEIEMRMQENERHDNIARELGDHYCM